MAREDVIREEAAGWAVRTGDPAFADWDGFTLWLEADPAHALAYDRVMDASTDAADALAAAPLPINDNLPLDEARPASARRRRFLGAMAAALAGVAVLSVWQLRDPSYLVETGPGETQMVELEGGVRIALAGDTRLVLDRDDTRFASLERGQALFTVDHVPAAPYRVRVGEDTLVDLGTEFDVRHNATGMSVAVSEGEVLFNPERQSVRIRPGQRLTSPAGSREYAIAAIPLAEVGEWLEGRLTFRDATLEQVAADLSAATGTSFTVSPRAAARVVSGSLMLDSVEADPRTVGPLLGVTIRFQAGAWELGA
jgi:transmembrane sensor